MGMFEVIIYVLILGGLTYLIFKKNSEVSNSEVDELKTEKFISTAAEAAAEAASKSVKRNLMYFKNYKKKTLSYIKKKLVRL